MRDCALNPERPCVLPYLGYKMVATRSGRKSGPEPSVQFRFIEMFDLRMNDKTEPGLTGTILFLNELIVPRTSTKLRRQKPFKQFIEVAVVVAHAFTGKLLIATNMMQMERQAGAFESAAAVSRLQHSMIPFATFNWSNG